VTAKFSLDPETSQYSLSIEVQAPIDMVVVRSPVVLDLTDGPAHAALSGSGGAIISATPPSMLEPLSTPDNPCRFLAAVRVATPQERRVSLFLRPTEGESGDLLLTIVTAGSPKLVKMLKFPLRPLSLNVRVHMLTEAELARPRHRVKFSGALLLLLLLLLFSSPPSPFPLFSSPFSSPLLCRYQSPSSPQGNDRGSIKVHKHRVTFAVVGGAAPSARGLGPRLLVSRGRRGRGCRPPWHPSSV
jgi:hypothetical protein